MLAEAAQPSQTEPQATQAAAAAQTPTPRKNKLGKKSQQPSADFLFALGKEEPGKNGLPILTECFTVEGEAMVAAFKGGVDYYKLQRCKVAVAVNEGTVTITSSAVEKPAVK
jgi:hypothetical protein